MKILIKILLFYLLLSTSIFAFENTRINLGSFSINKYEITIKEFSEYADKNKITTLAEKNGGSYEWGVGWVKRSGWNFRKPYGKFPDSILEPVVHINRFEAENYCKSIGGKLPSFKEWKLAAYTQLLESKKFKKNKTYTYPSGDKAEGMNSQGLLNYNKHMDVTKLPEGINGLVAMGGNVWEWISDQNNSESLTAGASWWYGPNKTVVNEVQFKPSNFYVLYIGFRCSFNN